MRNHRALPCTSCALTGSEGKIMSKIALIKGIGAVGGIEPPLRHQVSNETANDLTAVTRRNRTSPRHLATARNI